MRYDYNTQRPGIILPEYGRNLQKMVEFMMNIENREERTRCAHAIVSVMSNLNPHYKENSDFKHKLWDHLAIISDFKLDVDAPYEMPAPETYKEKPKNVPYCKNNIVFKHYGKTVELLVDEAIEMDDEEKKSLLIKTIANHMKRLYLTWNNDEIVGDEQIYKDLEVITNGRININKEEKLADSRDILKKKPVPSQPETRYKQNNYHNKGNKKRN